ncbi:MAG: hypothetical protein LBK25_03210 [Treponema sp.]|nr:hypothetical protein [Treponema sp.]
MNSIRRLGISVLNEKPVPLRMVEFMRQFDSGYGDYTNERHNWVDELTIEDISAELKMLK